MRRLLLSIVMAMSLNTIFGQNPALFNPTVYTKPLPKIITVPNQPSDFKFTSHLVNIKVPADSAKRWNPAMEKRYIKRLFTVVKDVDCLVLNYSGFYMVEGMQGYTIENGFQFHRMIRNEIANIGLPLTNASADYGSEKLLSVTTLSEDNALRPEIMVHEFFHQWNSYLEFADYWLRDPSFHTGLIEDDNSIFEAHRYAFNHVTDSIYSYRQGFGTGFPAKLEGYLAGLWDMPSELKTLKNYWHYNTVPFVANGDGSYTVQVKADSLIVLNKERLFGIFGGERYPNYQNSKKHFDGAIVVFSLNDFLNDDKLKGFHYMSMLSEQEGTSMDYNNLYDLVCLNRGAYMKPDYEFRQTNLYHSSLMKFHYYTRLFKDDGTKFEVPNYDGVISGNASVCAGATNIVYSIPAIKNATSYVWTLPSGATGTSTTNNITVNYGIGATSGNIAVKGRNDVSDGNVTILPIHILDSKSLPALPDPIIGRKIVCAGQNSVLYTVPDITNASSYVWTLPTGATGTSSTNTISVSYSPTASPGDISVKGINCNGAGESRKLAVIVNQLPANIEIEGPTSIPMGDTVKYSIPSIPNATSYSWFGSSIIGKNTSTSILISVKEKISSFGFNVTVFTECGIGVASKFKIVSVTAGQPANGFPGAGGVISGPASMCKGGFATYTVPLITNATIYQWYGAGEMYETSVNTINLPAPKENISSFGLTVTGINSTGAGTPSMVKAINLTTQPPAPVITLTGNVLHSTAPLGNQWYNQNGIITGAVSQNYTPDVSGDYYSIQTDGGCGSDKSNSIQVTVAAIQLPGSAGTINGVTSLCQGQNSTIYTVPAITNATSYSWTLPQGATGTSTTNSISVNYGVSAVSGNITVKGHNTGGDGIASTLPITVNPIPATPIILQNGKVLSSNAPSGNQWYNLNNPISGATNQDYTITSVGEYSVQVTKNGCVSAPSNMIKDVITGITTVEYNEKIKVYPNPVSDDLTIEYKGNTDEIKYGIYNSAGQLVTTGVLLENTVIHTSSFSSGVYTIKFNTGINFDFRKVIKHN